MTLRAGPDPRADLGYEETDAPRSTRRRPGAATFWTFVERDARPGEEAGGAIGGKLKCRDRSLGGCGEDAVVLHADPRSPHPQRVLCGHCAGKARAEKGPDR